jgi:type IX secretion system PorP/SprF family membrane protein
MRRFGALFLILCSHAFGQDLHLSQIDQTLPIINPALTSSFNGFEKFSIQHRNQWLGAGTQFMTSYGLAEFSIGKTRKMNKAYAGVGVYFINDVGGDSKISLKTGGINLSGNLPISNNQWISAGIQTSFNNRSADLSNLLFYSQWNGTNLDGSIPSGEENQFNSFSYLDAGGGISYNYKPSQTSTIGHSETAFQMGLSLSHINRPNQRFNSFTEDKLYTKLCIHANLKYGISDVSALEFSAVQFFQGKHKETNIGIFIRNRMKESSRITSLVNGQHVTLGAYFRLTGALTPYAAIDLGPFKIGLSYDYEIGKVSRAYNHSIEFFMSYMLSKNSIFKSKKLH